MKRRIAVVVAMTALGLGLSACSSQIQSAPKNPTFGQMVNYCAQFRTDTRLYTTCMTAATKEVKTTKIKRKVAS